MTVTQAASIARTFGLTPIRDGNRLVIAEALHLSLSQARAAKISAEEWRNAMSAVVHER